MNLTAIFALIIGIGIVLFSHGNSINSVSFLIQPTAFLIVIGGTICATILNFSPNTLIKALNAAKSVFLTENQKETKIISEIINLAQMARHEGLFSLNDKIDYIQDNFLRRGIQLAIDVNNNPQLVYDVLEAEISYEEEQEIINSRIFEAMGGYAPTFGIVGAVLGLIQIMGNLQDMQILGAGIAVAFVSTLYGVAIANLIFLPIAGNLKSKLREKILLKEVMLQGIMSIQMQESPTLVEEKLLAYLKFHNKKQIGQI